MEFEEQWKGLVLYIVNKHFGWVYMDVGPSHKKIRRSIDREDLIHEGLVAVHLAQEKYDPSHLSKSSFKTYAYKVIYNTLIEYIDRNSSVLSVARPRQVRLRAKTDRTISLLDAAMGYSCFSEVILAKKQDEDDEVEFVPGPSRDIVERDDPALKLERDEFKESCLQKLRDGLTEEEYHILLMRFSGLSYPAIAARQGMSKETARGLVIRAGAKSRQILERELEESDTDGGIHWVYYRKPC